MKTYLAQSGLYLMARIVHACETLPSAKLRPKQVSMNAANLLLGTAAQESHFRYRRQLTKSGQPMSGWRGGWSLFQVEEGSCTGSVAMLEKRKDLLDWANECVGVDNLATYTPRQMLEYSRINDNVGIVLARLHYLRVPGAIPMSPHDQAVYWKAHYNTEAGKGTVEQYLSNWRTLCVPVVKGWEKRNGRNL